MLFLVLMILVMPYEENPHLKLADSFLGIIPSLTVIKALGMAGLVWAALDLLHSPVRLLATPQARAFALFMALVAASVLLVGADQVWLTKYIAIAFFFPLVLAAVRTEAQVVLALKVSAVSVLISAVYGLRQMRRFNVSLGNALTDPNYYSALVVLLIPIVLALGWMAPPGPRRRAWYWAAGFLVVALILTASRGGFLGLLVVLCLLAHRMATRARLITAVAVAGALTAGVFWLPTDMGARLRSTIDLEHAPTDIKRSTEIRQQLLAAGLEMIADYPITGIGVGHFRALSPLYAYTLHRGFIAHNSYLEIGVELGLPTLGVYLAFLYLLVQSLQRSERVAGARRLRRLAVASTGIRIAVLAFLVPAAFISAQYEKFFWLLAFLSMCIDRIVTQTEHPA